MTLPDVLGWELPRAVEECTALGISVSSVVTAPPAGPAGGVVVPIEREDQDVSYRVVAVRPGRGGGALLVACAEKW